MQRHVPEMDAKIGGVFGRQVHAALCMLLCCLCMCAPTFATYGSLFLPHIVTTGHLSPLPAPVSSSGAGADAEATLAPPASTSEGMALRTRTCWPALRHPGLTEWACGGGCSALRFSCKFIARVHGMALFGANSARVMWLWYSNAFSSAAGVLDELYVRVAGLMILSG